MENLLKLANSDASIAVVVVLAVAIVVVLVANKYFETQKSIAESQPREPAENPEMAKALQDMSKAVDKLTQFLELTEKNNEELRRRDNELMQDILKICRTSDTKLTELRTMCQGKKCPGQVAGS